MDSGELVDWQIEAGRRLLAQLTRDGFEVAAAFWVKTAEEGVWFLYIVSPLVEQTGLAVTYRSLLASLQKLEGTPISFSDVRLTGTSSKIAQDALMIIAKKVGKSVTRYDAKQLGDMSTDEVFFYPRHFYNTEEGQRIHKEEIIRDLTKNLMRGPGIFAPNRITLKDGSSFLGFLTTLHVNSEGEASAEFMEQGKEDRRHVTVDEIAAFNELTDAPRS
jgi:hypothetical protein